MAKATEELLFTTRCIPSTVGKSMTAQDKVVYRIQPEDNTETLRITKEHKALVHSIFGHNPKHSW